MDERAAPPTSSFEMRTPAVLSAGVHVFAMVAAVVNLNFFSRPPVEQEPLMVEFEAIDKKAAAPTIGNPPPQPKDAKIDKETAKAPPPKTAEPITRVAGPGRALPPRPRPIKGYDSQGKPIYR